MISLSSKLVNQKRKRENKSAANFSTYIRIIEEVSDCEQRRQDGTESLAGFYFYDRQFQVHQGFRNFLKIQTLTLLSDKNERKLSN